MEKLPSGLIFSFYILFNKKIFLPRTKTSNFQYFKKSFSLLHSPEDNLGSLIYLAFPDTTYIHVVSGIAEEQRNTHDLTSILLDCTCNGSKSFSLYK